jgi:pimeloyl-ACP methyl ester carboxylesterase
MSTVTSQDGTPINYVKTGAGPVIIIITGALGVGTQAGDNDLAKPLEPNFTVINYDRRGRGGSGDTPPYAVQREVEDIEALIDANGGSAYLFGLSSGAVLALEAASKLGSKVKKLAMYEPPFLIDDSRPPVPADYVAQLNTAIAQGRRSDAVEIFMTKAINIPQEYLAMMKQAPPPSENGEMTPPPWHEMEAVAHTLAYDGIIMGDTMRGKPLDTSRWASDRAPTLVVVGGNSESFFHSGAQALVAGLPNAKYEVLPGQDHAVAPAALAPVLAKFFNS